VNREHAMNNAKRSPERVKSREDMGARLELLRRRIGSENFAGDHLNRWLGASFSSWYRYERGARIPGDLVCRLILETGVSPRWLLTGEGEMIPGQVWETARDLARRRRPGRRKRA
jgi:hypothetical protein